ncbi:MAG: VOC family protein [Verrucomicrobiota bacterium]
MEIDPKYTTHGTVSWTELLTTNPEAAQKFYAELFGWKYNSMPVPGTEGVIYHSLRTAGADEKDGQGGIMAMPPEVPAGTPPGWTSYVTVDDVDASLAKVAELGGEVIMPPMDVKSVGRMAWIKDPQGAVIAIIKYAVDEWKEMDC